MVSKCRSSFVMEGEFVGSLLLEINITQSKIGGIAALGTAKLNKNDVPFI